MSLLGFALLVYWAIYDGRVRNPESPSMDSQTASALYQIFVGFVALGILLFVVNHFAPRFLPAPLHGKSRRARRITFIVISIIVAGLVLLNALGHYRLEAIDRAARTEAMKEAIEQ